ncbi:lytic murein transglycosylase [Dactylosporangium sucinum]|uniref:lytic transglycosylase domain-containing protein n=1 Tax=Dactylosporangium sucinum TaxID=1424081 RepID=UPI00167C750F|nr:lytic murein transglycosylase [Dactylosporangium sucinum]
MARDDDRTPDPRDEPAETAGQPSTMDTLSVTAIRPPAPERGPDLKIPAQPHVPRHAAPESPGDVLESKQGRLAERRDAVRTWAGRPGGRTMVVGAVILAMLALAFVGGRFIVPATAKPDAGASKTAIPAGTNGGSAAGPETGNAPVPQVPTETPSYSPPPGTKERPADVLAVWAAPRAVKLDIPPVAMQAYGYAELITARTTPKCKLTWTTLAGIAKVESNHGRFNGALLQEDGKSVPTIIGPPLDGQSGRQAIRDTDQGLIDTDKTWDRAVGPMQFLPSTWKQYGIDADNDGVIDINDIDDASLTAAAYLCADGRDLSTLEGWNAAIHAYNVPEEYRAAVFNAANDYGRRDRTG